jgi:hypothetical protein
MSASVQSFAHLLTSVVNDPGIVSSAYSQFHTYSLGNVVLSWLQCAERGIQPGPLATFNRWKELGRFVKKGQKALTLCRPVTSKRTKKTEAGEEEVAFTRFVFVPRWFVLAQTDGAAIEPQPIPEWDASRALAALNIQEVPFSEHSLAPTARSPFTTADMPREEHEATRACLRRLTASSMLNRPRTTRG